MIRSRFWRRLVIAATAVIFAAHPFHLPIGPNLIDCLHYFLTGFLLADLCATDWQKPPVNRALWDLVATISWVTLVFVLMKHNGVDISILACMMLGFAGTFRSRFWNWLLTRPLITTIGGMCYTIYLYHPLIKSLIARHTVHISIGKVFWVNSLFQILLLYPAIVVICALLFMLTERPFMRRDWTKIVWQKIAHRA